ncbi:unnamed protein product [Rotaria socialis]|uniref:Uncharacterized protein n=1 Tax=Rotaria socialis TaxID=392032 RepID=A0A818APA1_9BILA|nr:unnamed protein product [Rotaria socialis]
MTDGLCAPRISKNVAREHNMCCNYGRSQKFVEQRRKTTASQQIHSAKLIWQARADEQRVEGEIAILRQKVYLQRLPQAFDCLIHQSADDVDTMLSYSVLDNNKCASLSSLCSKMVAQYKYDIMAMKIVTKEELARSHAKRATDEKKKLVESDGQDPQITAQMTHIIEERELNMVKRAQQIRQRQIESFFVDAPAVVMDDGLAVTNTVGANF